MFTGFFIFWKAQNWHIKKKMTDKNLGIAFNSALYKTVKHRSPACCFLF